MSTTRTQVNVHLKPAEFDIPDEPSIKVIGPLSEGELVLDIQIDGHQVQFFFAFPSEPTHSLENETDEQIEILAGQFANAGNELMAIVRRRWQERREERAYNDAQLDKIRS